MIRRGAPAHQMHPVVDEEIFFLRLKLLIIMAKGYLKGYPLGDWRKTAVNENARAVFYLSLHRIAQLDQAPGDGQVTLAAGLPRLFYQRAQLLAVMVSSFAMGNSVEAYRRQALTENIHHICDFLVEQFHLSDLSFLKVA